LTNPEVTQLRAKAERLEEPVVVALCDEVLGGKTAAKAATASAARAAKATKTKGTPR
jgi:hypothetical protein